ncbi:MAG: AhpC/TSA family protein [Flavisolibacter sp.]|nr:AhpC/TSA family protein [Flavisolibacter sp.]
MNKSLMGLSCFLSLAFLISCSSDSNQFVVEGSVKNTPARTVYLEEGSFSNMQPIIIDSAQIDKDGSFKLKGTGKEESLYVLRLSGNNNPFASLINDTKKITVKADIADIKQPYTVQGSPASTELSNYMNKAMQKAEAIYNISLQVDQSGGAANDSLINELMSKRKAEADEFRQYTVSVANNSKHAPMPVFAIGLYQSLATNPAFGMQPFSEQELKDLINRTAARFPRHQATLALQKSFQEATQQSQAAPASLLNKPAPDFTLPNVNGQPVTLSSLRGKYVLVDFWASWCKPCRMENPNVVKAYQKFNNKNFTVLGVSLDKEKDAWINAIKQDNLTWTHISDLKFWDSKVVPLYNIEGIPYNVLIDPNGVVIGEGLRGEALETKLQEVLK